MKIKQKHCSYEEALAQKENVHNKPLKPNLLFRSLMRMVSEPELKKTNFEYRQINMDRLGKKEPCMILMNHSSLLDLKIAVHIFSDRPFNIVCTSDGFVGKEWLMRHIGCIPAIKFVNDCRLSSKIEHFFRKLTDRIEHSTLSVISIFND